VPPDAVESKEGECLLETATAPGVNDIYVRGFCVLVSPGNGGGTSLSEEACKTSIQDLYAEQHFDDEP